MQIFNIVLASFLFFTATTSAMEPEVVDKDEKMLLLNGQSVVHYNGKSINLLSFITQNLTSFQHENIQSLDLNQRKIIAQNLLKHVGYSSDSLIFSCDEAVIRSALIHVLTLCNEDFKISNNTDSDLVSQFKETVTSLSLQDVQINQNDQQDDQVVVTLIPNTGPASDRDFGSIIRGGGPYACTIVVFLFLAYHVGPLLMVFLPIPLGGETPAMIGLTVGGIILTVLAYGASPGCYVYNRMCNSCNHVSNDD